MVNLANRGTKCPLRVPGALTLLWIVFGVSQPLSPAPQQPTANGRNPNAQQSAASEEKQDSGNLAADPHGGEPIQAFTITVVDENGVPVPSAKVFLVRGQTQSVIKAETDLAGRCKVHHLVAGLYHVRAEKEGFYVVRPTDVRAGEEEGVEIALHHQQEFVQRINVTYSPPAIDLAKTTAGEGLNSREILHLPYSVPRDIRYALPLIPGVLQDATGQVHVDGASSRETVDQLDGFNINAPASGLFTMRMSVDALRSVDVLHGRYPVEYGKGSGGVLSLITGMGDDHFHLSSSDFLPSFLSQKGFGMDSWTPRFTFSGPLRRGKAWFLLAPEGEYHQKNVDELPRGANRTAALRVDNLAKAQVHLTPGNILTGSYLVNHFRSEHAGLSRFNPLETTINSHEAASLVTLKDQAFLSNGMLLEVGLGLSQFHSGVRPMGDRTYVISPEGTSGNFFESQWGRSTRLQQITKLVLPTVQWHGRHQFEVGTDIDRISENQSFGRRPFTILRENGALSRNVDFAGYPPFSRNNLEVGVFVQDHWSPSDRLVIESGLRSDWDEIIRSARASPRLAASYMLTRDAQTKIVGGIGLYSDATSLDFITNPQTGRRFDSFYDSTGQRLVRAPVETSFQVNERNLKEPRFLTWSGGVERKLPGTVYSSLEFTQKRGQDGMTFINQCASQPNCISGHFELRNDRQDHYDSVKLTLRRAFKGDHIVFASYTRSAARSNAVLNFNLQNPLFSPQAGGPLPWDSPNRFISWGILPVWRKIDLAYSLDWRDGYPFSQINENQQIVGPPDSRRYPTYFSLSLALERQFPILGYLWALRAGMDDVTDRKNPNAVNNNVDSPNFLTFGAMQHRAITAHIRFLGRK